jgi:UDP-N-acetylmuramyl pentapeptide phosphotransferase/UDP-N-acetylglucosamine-1-phosphate transferase
LASKPTALYGGVAIVLAAVLGGIFFLPASSHYIGVAAGALFIFAVGLYDDRFQFASGA